ncbi:MAG: Crp/Fnr family transcriptional regulator [Flavobacteriaceae bacterium]|nr:Crp/Fnr family transcriptional regulator [Flavobacteriaceae bacterium]
MNQFITYLLQFDNLNQQQIDFIKSKASELKVSKDEYFWEAGKMPKQVGFIYDGIIRVCYFNKDGEDITRYFFEENHLIKEWEGLGATFYLQACTDCKFVVFSKADWNEISNTIVNGDAIIQKIVAKLQIEKLERRSALVSQDASTRYLSFLENFPNVVNRVALSHIASYIGVTQQSLSRIRRNIT